jgi:hypothetical protein
LRSRFLVCTIFSSSSLSFSPGRSRFMKHILSADYLSPMVSRIQAWKSPLG